MTTVKTFVPEFVTFVSKAKVVLTKSALALPWPEPKNCPFKKAENPNPSPLCSNVRNEIIERIAEQLPLYTKGYASRRSVEVPSENEVTTVEAVFVSI